MCTRKGRINIRRLKRFLAAITLATTLFLSASFGREPDEPPELPISPVAYDDSAELAELERQKQARRSELARAKAEEAKSQALLAQAASKPEVAPVKTISRSEGYVGKAQTYEATAYTAYCEGCSGITKTGVNLRKSIYHEGRRVIAVDPRYIPLGSIVRVTLSDGSNFEAVAEDIGGVIKGAIIDVAHETKADANRFGRQTVEVRLIRKGR